MGKTILISSHVLTDLADLCDRLFVLERGAEVFSGTIDELKAKVTGPRRIEIAVGSNSEDAARHLRGRSWAQDVRQENGVIELTLADSSLPLQTISASRGASAAPADDSPAR